MRTHVCVYMRVEEVNTWLAIKPLVKGRGQMMPFVLPFKQNCAHVGETLANNELANGDYVSWEFLLAILNKSI